MPFASRQLGSTLTSHLVTFISTAHDEQMRDLAIELEEQIGEPDWGWGGILYSVFIKRD